MKLGSRMREQFRPTKLKVATSLLALSGLWGFAATAISAEDSNAPEISNGAVIQLGDGLSIAPISGWSVERKSLGMGLVMREVLPPRTAPIDYTKPIFARNITLTTLPEAKYIDEKAVDEIKADISKMIARDSSLKDFSFTDQKIFDYKGKNDGIVLFSQLTVNGFQMMQMQVVVSGDKKAYLMTYSDMASNFSNPATYDAAWKSMTSVVVKGEAPKRYENEIFMGGSLLLSLLAIIVPFVVVRRMSSRRLRKLTEELQYDWDHNSQKSDADYDLSDIHSLDETRPAKKKAFKKKAPVSDMDMSSLSAISTLHSRFA